MNKQIQLIISIKNSLNYFYEYQTLEPSWMTAPAALKHGCFMRRRPCEGPFLFVTFSLGKQRKSFSIKINFTYKLNRSDKLPTRQPVLRDHFLAKRGQLTTARTPNALPIFCVCRANEEPPASNANHDTNNNPRLQFCDYRHSISYR